MNDLAQRALAAIAETDNLEGMAAFEGWTPVSYALTLANHIRNPGTSLQVQTERLAALAQVGAGLTLDADRATAEALSQHYAVLEALSHRFAYETFKALNAGGKGAPEVADRYLSASLRAQRAAMGVLSALKVLRDSTTAPTRPPAPVLISAPSLLKAEVPPLSGLDC